jgi:hypothetical protein
MSNNMLSGLLLKLLISVGGLVLFFVVVIICDYLYERRQTRR